MISTNRFNDAHAIRKIRAFLPYNRKKAIERRNDVVGVVLILSGFAGLAIILSIVIK